MSKEQKLNNIKCYYANISEMFMTIYGLYKFNDSIITETILRSGELVKMFNIDIENESDLLQRIAIYELQKSMVLHTLRTVSSFTRTLEKIKKDYNKKKYE